MKTLLKIKFGKSRSSNYPFALDIACGFPDFTPISKEKEFNSLEINKSDMIRRHKEIFKLIDLIQNWKSSLITINGRMINHASAVDLKILSSCYDKSDNFFSKANYCDNQGRNGWGCKNLILINKHLPKEHFCAHYVYWFNYGEFIDESMWVINKKALKNALLEEAEQNFSILCPLFNVMKIDNIIDSLPEFIDLRENKRFRIQYDEIDDGMTPRKVPSNILPVDPNLVKDVTKIKFLDDFNVNHKIEPSNN